MTDHDDLLKELGEALKVEPSRHFAEGVRARVRKSHRTAQIWWGLAAAATITIGVATLWQPFDGRFVRPADTTTAQVQAPVQAITPVVQKAAPEAAPVVKAETGGRRVVRVAAKTVMEPRLEVITNQPALLRELWVGLDARRMPLVEGDAPKHAEDTKPIAMEPIVVPPIVVGEIGREPGSAGGTPIIRRANATKETK